MAPSDPLPRPLLAGAVASVREHFPGTEQVAGERSDETSTRADRKEMADLHTGLLWDAMEGFACIFIGHGGNFGSPRYSFASTQQRFFAWPGQRKEMLETSMAAAPMADVYLAPMLRTTRSRKKGTGGPSRYLWADVDGQWTKARSDTLAPLMTTGSFVVGSGSGRHVYVRLSEPQGPEKVEHLNRRLAVALDGDAKWDDTALLRLAGTWNHKGTARGTGATLVRWSLG